MSRDVFNSPPFFRFLKLDMLHRTFLLFVTCSRMQSRHSSHITHHSSHTTPHTTHHTSHHHTPHTTHHPPLQVSEPPTFEEEDDAVIVGGVKISKPFVEKPVDGENHDIHVFALPPLTNTLFFCFKFWHRRYYPRSAGGGSKHLFRKTGDESSSFHPEECRVRRDGSYIYEQFMNTEGTDVKVYASLCLTIITDFTC